MKIHFIFPPIWECDAPYTSIASLAAYLKENGHQVTAIDLNIKIQNEILETGKLRKTVKRLERILNYESDDKKRKHIQEVLSLSKLIDFAEFSRAINVLKSETDIKKTVRAKKILEIGRYIYSAQYYPAHFFSYEYMVDGKRTNTISSLIEIVMNQEQNIFERDIKKYVDSISGKYDLIGISVASTNQLIAALTIAKKIKNSNSNTKICLGGAVLPYMYESIKNTPLFFEFFDYVILGEGETALLKLVQHLQRKCNIEDVPNIFYTNDGVVVENHLKTYENIHKLPVIDYQIISWEQYWASKRMISYLASRGCYWNKCSFCGLTSNYGQKYRTKSADKIVDDLEMLCRINKSNFIVFNDEALTAFEIKTISEEILKREVKIYWSCLCRLDKQHNIEIFELAYSAGLRIISFGLENGSQRILEMMNKGIDLGVAEKVIRDSSKAGIWNNIYLMLGFPGETREDIQCTMDFLEKNKLYIDTLGYGEFRLDGYSEVFKCPEKYNICISPYSKDYFGPDYCFEYMTPEDRSYIKSFERYLLQFEFNPSYFAGIDLNLLLVNLANNKKSIIKRQIFRENKYKRDGYTVMNGKNANLYMKNCIRDYQSIEYSNQRKTYVFYSAATGMSIQLIGDLDIFLEETKKGGMMQDIIEKYMKKYGEIIHCDIVEDFLRNVAFHLADIGLINIEERE